MDREQFPSYAGPTTFNQVPAAHTEEELAAADVAIVGAPMDDLVTYRPGARFGPRAIRVAQDGGPPASWHMDLGVDPFAGLSVVDHGDAAVRPGDPHTSHRAIRDAVTRVLEAGCVPVVLGGDHSIAYPDIAAVLAHHEPGTVAVVLFDTHADIGETNWGVEWAHGTPFRKLVDGGLLAGEKLVQVGLRGYWPFPEEFAWMRSSGIRWHRMEEVARRGIEAVMDDVVAAIADVPHVYLSVDIDALDPAYAPGTGTPEPGGLSTRELLAAVRRLVFAKGMVGMEVVEVSPPYDHADITAMAAHRVVVEAVSALALNRDSRAPAPEDP
jgi:agmatinase